MRARTTPSPAAPPPDRAALAGTWEGAATTMVNWCRTRTFTLRLEVDAAGHVSGRIGDALLDGGTLSRNRPWFLGALPLFSAFVVRGELRGALLAGEALRRRKVSLPLDLAGGMLVGALHTDGVDLPGAWPAGAKKFSALVRLSRCERRAASAPRGGGTRARATRSAR